MIIIPLLFWVIMIFVLWLGVMGVSILPDHFDTIDIMKDLEMARHALDRSSKEECKDPNDFIPKEEVILEKDIPMIEWVKDDSESKSFTLVQSRKEKRSSPWWKFLLRTLLLGGVVELPLLCTRVKEGRKIMLLQ
jgi:hypothetical protein